MYFKLLLVFFSLIFNNPVLAIVDMQRVFSSLEQPYFNQIIVTPWVKHFIKGDLPLAVFQNFLREDTVYLLAYEQASLSIAARFAKKDERHAFFKAYAKAAAVEREWEIKQLGLASLPLHSAFTQAYTAYMLHTAQTGNLAAAIAVLLPCDTLWMRLGKYMQSQVTVLNIHPYKRWIILYNDPSMKIVADKLVEIENDLLTHHPELMNSAVTAYKRAAYYEVDFFHKALMEK